jgi:transglutaminase-like putative cysteine protease
MKTRPIDQRYEPLVRGVDLWQALNYISLDDVTLDFAYNRYTSSRVVYDKGSRPKLEKIVRKEKGQNASELGRIAALARYVAENVRWAGYYERDAGRRLPVNRGLNEEELVESRFGWCNEQARLLCSLVQIDGFPSRIVFASNKRGNLGHVVTEVLTTKGWLLVDQSFGYCFIYRGRPSSAWDVCHQPAEAKYYGRIYRSLCNDLRNDLGTELLSRDFSMAVSENPLLGFERLGYCNHWTG